MKNQYVDLSVIHRYTPNIIIAQPIMNNITNIFVLSSIKAGTPINIAMNPIMARTVGRGCAPLIWKSAFQFIFDNFLYTQQARKIIVPDNATSPTEYNFSIPGNIIPATIQAINVPINTTIGKPILISAINKYIPAINKDANTAHIPYKFPYVFFPNFFIFISPQFSFILIQNFIPTEENYKIDGIGISTEMIKSPQKIRNVDIEVNGESQYQRGQTTQHTEWRIHSYPYIFRLFHPLFSNNDLSYSRKVIFYKNYISKLIIVNRGRLKYQKLQTGNLFLIYYYSSFLVFETSPNIQTQVTDVVVFPQNFFWACFFASNTVYETSFLSLCFSRDKSISRAVFALHTVFMDLSLRIILSMTILVFLYTIIKNIVSNNTCNVPSRLGGIWRSKNPRHRPLSLSIAVWVCFQENYIGIVVMSPKILRLSHVSKEYFQSPYDRVYKICNRYKKCQKTLDKFGLKIDQGKRELPEVWSHDRMSIKAPNEQIQVDANKTYPQDWEAYNLGQTKEKILFLEFLYDLTSQIPKRRNNVRRGRPSIDIGDMIYCCCLKIYLDFSSRRTEGDVQLAYDLGYIDNIPHFNTILNYLNKPELKTYLTQLIHLSALPLKDFEKTFTVDATGFSTSMYGRWLNIRACSKMEVVNIRKYMKCHIMSGAKTNIITHVEVTDHTVHDTIMFPDLVNTTGEFFDMQKICADMGYMSRKNYSIASRHGTIPFIPFKTRSSSRAGGVPMWHTMYRFFKDNYDEFMKHYHQRSNVESTFSMIKRKFGDYLRCKNPVACTNEILVKCLVHNLCCLVQEMFTLGIKVEFEENAERIFCAGREVY